MRVGVRNDAKLLIGDALIAISFISDECHSPNLPNSPHGRGLLSIFNKEGKQRPMSENANPLKLLMSEAEVAQWNADSLPADVVSTENESIVTSTSRWPLSIDPQHEGIRWLMSKESVVRLGQKDLIRKLENVLAI